MPIKNSRAAKHFGFSGYYELPPFWVVTKPTIESELEDIFFESDLFGFILQEKGGLRGSEWNGIIISSRRSVIEQASILASAMINMRILRSSGIYGQMRMTAVAPRV